MRTTVPIVAWATVGAAFIALAIYVASSWILGGRATPTPIGANNPTLGRDLAWNIGAQVLTIIAVIGTLIYKLKPVSAKGVYVKSVVISTTHGPGIKIDPAATVRASA